MEIVKLGDLINIQTGNMNKQDNSHNGKYNFYTRSTKILKSDYFTFEGEGVLIPGEGIFIPIYVCGKFGLHQRVYYISSKNEKLLNKYLYYWILKNINLITKGATGSTVKSLRLINFTNVKINLIPHVVQQQIIDIIEPKEELFIKYNNLIRIDNINDFKNDWKVLIDIIEPFELLLGEINQKINKIKNILRLNYVCSYSNEFIKIVDIIKIHNDKYKDQNYYFATNGISEFEIDYSKVIDIREKRPSRANLTPKENSLIFSKLIGENKVLYIDEHNDYVFSTGFYNITTKYIDFVTGFLLSNDFIEQKSKFSNGTTMIGLNLEGLNKIEIKKPKKEGQTLILFMNNLIKQKYFVEKIINGLIEKYIH